MEKVILTPELTKQIEHQLNLSGTPDILRNAKQTEIEVPDYDIARLLVSGDDPILKRMIDEMSESLGNKLKAKKCEFEVLDFTQMRDPKEVLDDFFKKYPKIRDPRIVNRHEKSFNDFYKGKVVVLLGVDAIPVGSDVFQMRNIAKHAPTVFIHKKFPSYPEPMNRHVFSSIGDYSFEKAFISTTPVQNA